MLTRASLSSRMTIVRAGQQQQLRAFASLQSEKPCAKLSDKIVRGKDHRVFYTHPSYVMAREKMLNTLWVDQGIFKYSVYTIGPFVALAAFFKA